MKYKEAFLNFVRLEDAKFDMNLDKASIDFQIYIMPLSKTYLRLTKALSNLLPTKVLYKCFVIIYYKNQLNHLGCFKITENQFGRKAFATLLQI